METGVQTCALPISKFELAIIPNTENASNNSFSIETTKEEIKQGDIELSKWPKNKMKLYNILNEQMIQYANTKLEEIAKRMSDDILERLLFTIKKRLNEFESSFKEEVTVSLLKFTRDMKSSIDGTLNERFIRAEKRMKDKLQEEKSKIRNESIKILIEEDKNKITLDQTLFDMLKRNASEPSKKGIKKSIPKLPESSIFSLRASKESSENQSMNQLIKNKVQNKKKSKKNPDTLETLYRQYTNIYHKNMGESIEPSEEISSIKEIIDNIDIEKKQ